MAASRKISVQVVGDTRHYERAMARVRKETRQTANAFDDFRLRARRASSLGAFRIAGIGLGAGTGLFAATQVVRELGDRLQVTGRAAFTTEGRLKNMVSALTSGSIVGAFEALRAAPRTLEDLGNTAVLGSARIAALREVAAGMPKNFQDMKGGAKAFSDEMARQKAIIDLAGTDNADLARALLGAQNAAFAASFAMREYNRALIDGIKVMVDYKGAHDANIGGVERERAARVGRPSIGPLSPSQRRELELVGAQGTARLPGLQDRLRQLNNQLQARGFNDEQRLRILNNIKQTEAEIAAIYRDQAAAAAAAASAAKAAAQARARAAEAARLQRLETQLGWLEFASERADVTKPINDNMKALRAIEDYWQERIRSEGRKLEFARELWRTQQRIRDLTDETDKDPLAGLMQASTKQLLNLLSAGTGLRGVGRRTLAGNIAGLQMPPITIAIDGREVGRAVTKDQTRTGRRTSQQTSGRRG